MKYMGQGKGGVTPATPSKVVDLSMSSVDTAKITVKPTKFMSLTLVTASTLLFNYSSSCPDAMMRFLLEYVFSFSFDRFCATEKWILFVFDVGIECIILCYTFQFFFMRLLLF